MCVCVCVVMGGCACVCVYGSTFISVFVYGSTFISVWEGCVPILGTLVADSDHFCL